MQAGTAPVSPVGGSTPNLKIREATMITCYLRYEIDPFKVKEFETYAKMWIPLVNKLGGTHHGYFLPHESSDYVAVAMFSFPVARRLRSLSRESRQRSRVPEGGCLLSGDADAS